MNISRIHVQRFGCLDDLTVDFVPGLNVIKGPNEAGKSTLHRAILLALFERPSKKRSTEAWRTWGEDRLFELALRFSVTGGEEWQLAKDFEEHSVRLSNGSGDVYQAYDAIQEKIGEFLGTSEIAIFTSTACVSQDAIADMSSGRKGIAQQLETIITGGQEDANTLDVIQKVTSTVRNYRRGYQTTAYANPGPIARLTNRQSELQGTVDELKEQDANFGQNMEKKQALAERLSEVESELTPRLQIQTMAGEYQQIEERFREWQRAEIDLESQIGRIQESEDGFARTLSDLDELGEIATLSDDEIYEMEQAQARLVFLRENPPAAPVPVFAKAPSGRRPRLWPPLMLFALALMGALGILVAVDSLLQFQMVVFIGLAAILLLLLVSGIWTIVTIIRRSRWAKRTRAPRGFSVPAELPELAALQDKLAQKLGRLGCDDWDEFLRKRASVETAEKARDRATSQLEVLVPDGKTKADLESERQQASRKRRDAEEQLNTPEMKRLAQLDAVALRKLDQEILGFQAEEEELSGELTQLNYAIAAATDCSEELLAAEEQLRGIGAEIERQLELLAAYELTLDMMEMAREKTLVRAHDQLAPKMGEFLATLTGGRYQRVHVSTDLSIEVWPPQEGAGPIPSDQLSRGARDQLYFAARLALVDLLFGDTKPPIFLDDPFVTFDPARRQIAIELCRTVALERQVFLFACTSEYDRYGHVIDLDGMRNQA